jgi:hypothetical protein
MGQWSETLGNYSRFPGTPILLNDCDTAIVYCILAYYIRSKC